MKTSVTEEKIHIRTITTEIGRYRLSVKIKDENHEPASFTLFKEVIGMSLPFFSGVILDSVAELEAIQQLLDEAKAWAEEQVKA